MDQQIEAFLKSFNQILEKISEKKLDAACGLCVGVGCFSDPENQGIANLFRHMVFMESEKYSEEIDFKAFIKERSGFVDVLTDSEQTTFYFDVQEKHLLSVLDRFAQGFINPLMKKDVIIRERENISEYKPVSYDENEELLFCAQTDPVNKYIQDSFMTFSSNKDDDKLCEELHKFRNRHYGAHRMTIAIQARLSLGTLEKFVTKCFVDVPSNKLSTDDYEDNVPCVPFNTSDIERILTGTRSHISHIMFKQDDKLEVTWTMPLPLDFYKNKPHEYIAWIIGYRGKGSLTSYLRTKMPCCIGCDNVQCNSKTFLRYNCIYTVLKLTVVLFCEKQEHLKEVLDAIFSFINLLKKEDPHKRTIYYDYYKIMEYNFRFINETDSMDYIVSLCKGMHFYPPRDYITANKLIYIEYNLEAIQKYLNYLKPETASITILQKNPRPLTFDYNEVQSCVKNKKKHIYIEVPKECIEHWKSIKPLPDFHLPLKNEFIASDFSLISIPVKVPKYPVKIYNDHVSEIWYRPDPKFRLPKCCMNLQFVSSLGIQSPKNVIFMEIYCRALKLLLFEELYPAVVAGFEYHISTSDKGIIIKMNGFIEKLPRLLITIANYMTNYPALVTKSLFESCKVQLLNEGYYSKAFMDPYHLIDDVKLSILKLIHYTDVEKHTVLSNVNFKEFRRFVKSFTDHLYVQCLVQGNITQDDAIETIQHCLKIINCGPLLSNTVQQMRVVQIPLGISYCKLKNIDKMNATSVVTNYYQFDVMSVELSVLLDLMMEMIEILLHNWVSNETMQFKVVSCDSDYINGVLGYSITVNTKANKCTTEHMDEQIEVFLQLFNGILNDFLEMDLDQLKERLIIEKKLYQYTDNVLKEEVDRNWSEIIQGEYVFDRYEREVLAIQNIKIDDLKRCFAKHIKNGNNFRKLSIHVIGNDPEKIAVEKENFENPKTEHFTLEYISDWGTSYDYHLTAYRTSTRHPSMSSLLLTDAIRLADVRRRDSRVAIVLICDRLLATDSLTVKPKAATHVTPG
ncbi:Nardilysin [Trachymyrmex zeteki]|uniref:Nardilysin n=1 Tax=Mycetomoellerius zeteki TaxID=64791 RepID=A0A151WU52_9HYME|nr:Nardilysin [Trachymyrmex zeteki]